MGEIVGPHRVTLAIGIHPDAGARGRTHPAKDIALRGFAAFHSDGKGVLVEVLAHLKGRGGAACQSHHEGQQRQGAKYVAHHESLLYLAEREGFEPSMQFLTACSLSRGVPSTTRPSLRKTETVFYQTITI